MALEEPNTAMSVYRQYLIWKIAVIRLADQRPPRMKWTEEHQYEEDEAYYQRLLREHNLRWAPFEQGLAAPTTETPFTDHSS